MRCVLVIFCLLGVAGAQGVLSDAAARKNLVKSPAAVAPAGVKAGGDVVLQVEIDFHGRVTGARVVSGPEKLRASALDAVARWEFKPFGVKGQAKTVKAKLVVAVKVSGGAPKAVVVAAPDAASGPEDAVAASYFALSDACHTLVAERADPVAEVKACRAAADAADKFGTESRFIERRSAYVFAATALMRTNDLKAATAYGTKAIGVVKQGHDDAAGASAAYTVRAQAEAYGGKLGAADQDLTIAEGFERDGLVRSAGTELEKSYRFGLKSVLGFHAQVLTGMGKADAAGMKTAEAGKL